MRVLGARLMVADGREVARVRAWLRDRIAEEFKAPPPRAVTDAVADLQTCVSELVTNALVHATPRRRDDRVRAVLACGDGVVGVEVTDTGIDRGSPPPIAGGAGLTAESGRGLTIVAELSARWGWHRTGSGTTVWCEIEYDTLP